MTKSPTELGAQITLDPQDVAKLAELASREKALGVMTQNFQQQFEVRASALQQESQMAWQAIGAKYGLDMRSVLYTASPDFTTLTAVQCRLPQQDIPGV